MSKVKKVSKDDIIREIAEESKTDRPLSVEQVTYVVNKLFDKIVGYAGNDIAVTIKYFGRFNGVEKKPRRFKTPQGNITQSAGHRTLSFKAGRALINKLNNM